MGQKSNLSNEDAQWLNMTVEEKKELFELKALKEKKAKEKLTLIEALAQSEKEQSELTDDDDDYGRDISVKNPSKRTEKLQKEFEEGLQNTQAKSKVWNYTYEQKGNGPEKQFVKEEYKGKCQICGRDAIIKYKNTSLIKEFLFFYKKLTLDNVFNVISILSGSDSSSVGVTYGFSYLISECETPQEASDYFNNQDKGSKLLPSDHILSHLISEINIYVNDPKKSIKYEDILVNFRNELNIDELIKFYQLFIYYKDKGKNIQKTQLLPYFLKEDTSSENKICNLIDDLDKFFTCYKSIVDNTLSGKFEPINTYLRFNIDRGFFTLHFSIDLLRNEEELSKDDIRKAMELNYAVLFRRKIAGINSGSDRANIGWVDEAIKRSKSEKIKFIDALKKIIHEQPKNIVGEMDNSRFYQDMKKYDFYSDKNDSIKYLLANVEYSNKDVNEFDIFSSKIKGYSVEHIMCQVNNQNNDRLNVIGNFTLITGVTNSSLGAKPFEEKKEGYEKSNLWLNKYFSDKEKWDETDIDLRTDYLIDLIIKAGFLNI
jgi:hypothetical protein